MRQYKKYLRRLRNFDMAIILALIMSIPLNVLLHLHGADDFDLEELLDSTLFNAIADRDVFPEALFDFATACTTLSAFRYAGRAVDVLTDEKTLLEPFIADIPGEINELRGKKRRNRATVAGAVLAIFMTIALAIILSLTGAWSIALVLTFVVGGLVLLSACAGLLSRLGQVADRIAQHKSVNRNYELSIIFSAALTIIPIVFLILNVASALMTPLGIFTLGCSCLVLLSGITSASHYLGLSLDFLTNDRSIFAWFTKNKPATTLTLMDRCNNEKLATTIGIVVGLAIGVTLLALGICMPAFLLALPLALKAPLIILLTMNMCASLAANIGRIVDRLLTTRKTQPTTLLHILLNKQPTTTDLKQELLDQRQSSEGPQLLLKPRKYATWSHNKQFSNTMVEIIEPQKKAESIVTSNTSYQRNSLWQFNPSSKIEQKPLTLFEPPSSPVLVTN